MKVGDKVRFLNTQGGGIVKGFKSKDIAIVEDQDGFEIPILARECIVIEENTEKQIRQSVKATNEIQSYVIESKTNNPIQTEETKEGELITACLVFLPADIKNISSTSYESYLINDSNYFLSYVYLNKNSNGWVKRASGVIEPNTKIFIEDVNKEDLNDIEKLSIQFLAYKEDKPFRLKNTFSVELKIDTVKFYKLHSFKENDYFDENAIVYYLVKKDLVEKDFFIDPQDIEESIVSKNRKEPSRIIKKISNVDNKGTLEIDLHIDELLDNTNGLESGDMLNYQLAKFREVMNENLSHKGKKIVFIHGKGNGVLKKALHDELKSKYRTCYIQDASFREYGFGATMVTIH